MSEQPLEAKGVIFLSMLEAIAEVDGQEARKRVVAAVQGPLAEALRSGALTRVGWYPIAWYGDLHTAMQKELRGGDEKVRLLGRRSTEIDTRGLLRYVLALSTPSLLFRYGAKIFGSYLRGGEVASEHLERKAELRFSNMSEAPDLMFVEWQGGISSLLEHAGAREVVVHPAVRKRSNLMRPSSNAPGDLVSIRVAWE